MKRYEDLKLSVVDNRDWGTINVDCTKVTSKDEFKYVDRGFNYIPIGENNEGYDKAREFLNDIDKIKFDNEKDLFDNTDEWMEDKHGTGIEGYIKDQYQYMWINNQTCLLIRNFEDGTNITEAIYCYDPQDRLIHYTRLDNAGNVIFDRKFDYDLKGRIIKDVTIDSFNSTFIQYTTYDDNTFTSVSNKYINGKFDNTLFTECTQWDNYFDRKLYSYTIDRHRIDNSICKITKYQYTADCEYTFSIETPLDPKRFINILNGE